MTDRPVEQTPPEDTELPASYFSRYLTDAGYPTSVDEVHHILAAAAIICDALAGTTRAYEPQQEEVIKVLLKAASDLESLDFDAWALRVEGRIPMGPWPPTVPLECSECGNTVYPPMHLCDCGNSVRPSNPMPGPGATRSTRASAAVTPPSSDGVKEGASPSPGARVIHNENEATYWMLRDMEASW